MKPTTPTSEQLAARRAAQAFFGDLLVPQGKVRNAKPTAAPQDKLWGSQHSAKLTSNAKAFTPVLRIHRITRQHCGTCGAVHSYAGTALVRFASLGRKDNLAIELPTALPLPEALDTPHAVEWADESTEFCANCVATCEKLDDILSAASAPQQLRLFV
jgi:hypothetical protein